MQRVVLFQLYDHDTQVTSVFNAEKIGEMYLSKFINFHANELEKVFHWADHSEIKILESKVFWRDWFRLLAKERASMIAQES